MHIDIYLKTTLDGTWHFSTGIDCRRERHSSIRFHSCSQHRPRLFHTVKIAKIFLFFSSRVIEFREVVVNFLEKKRFLRVFSLSYLRIIFCKTILYSSRHHHKSSIAALISLLKSINSYFQYQWTNNRPVDISVLIFVPRMSLVSTQSSFFLLLFALSCPLPFFLSTHVELCVEWQTMCNLFRIVCRRLCWCASKVSTTHAEGFVFLLILFSVCLFFQLDLPSIILRGVCVECGH